MKIYLRDFTINPTYGTVTGASTSRYVEYYRKHDDTKDDFQKTYRAHIPGRYVRAIRWYPLAKGYGVWGHHTRSTRSRGAIEHG